MIIHNGNFQAQRDTSIAAKQLYSQVEEVESVVESIAMMLNAGKLADDQIESYLKKVFDEMPTPILEIGIAYNPEISNKYAPHYGLKNGILQHFNLADSYDYTGYGWFKNSLKSPNWFEPYFGKATNSLVAGFGAPFYDKAKNEQQNIPAGVIRINFSLDGLKSLVRNLNIGKTGYAFLMSQNGCFIDHPKEKYTVINKSASTLAVELEQEGKPGEANALLFLSKTAKESQNSKFRIFEFKSSDTERSNIMFCKTVGDTGWLLGEVYIKDELYQSREILKRREINIALSLITLLISLSIAILFCFYKYDTKGLWIVSGCFSLFILIGIGFICYKSLGEWSYSSTRISSAMDNTIIVDSVGLRKTLNSYEKRLPEYIEDPIYIPTGIFIQSIEFLNSTNVSLSGYVWQKYYDNIDRGIDRGFVFPESVSAEINKAYSRDITNKKGEKYKIIGWYFETVLRQSFDYSRYPLDRKQVWIRLWHKDFDRHIILTPDLDSYKLINPSSKPGIEDDFVFSGWEIEGSFFEYKFHSYNSNFGIEDYVGGNDYPELYFTTLLKREFKDACITNLVPLFVVASMLFAILITITKKEYALKFFDFSIMNVLGACSALFFIVIFAHIQLRRELVAPTMIYLEYYYFLMYLAILVISINAFMVSMDSKSRFIQYKNNLISHLLYWPITLIVLLVVTLIYFY